MNSSTPTNTTLKKGCFLVLFFEKVSFTQRKLTQTAWKQHMLQILLIDADLYLTWNVALMEFISKLRIVIKLKLNFIISSKCSAHRLPLHSSFLTLAGAADATQRMTRMQEKMCSILQAQKQQSSPETVNYWSSSTAHDRQRSRGDREQSQWVCVCVRILYHCPLPCNPSHIDGSNSECHEDLDLPISLTRLTTVLRIQYSRTSSLFHANAPSMTREYKQRTNLDFIFMSTKTTDRSRVCVMSHTILKESWTAVSVAF